MPTIKRRASLGANETANPLTGSQYEYLPRDARVEFAILADTAGQVEATVHTGSDVLLEASEVDERAIAEPIQYPYDVVAVDLVGGGERLGLFIRETAGAVGPTIVRVQVWITWV